MKSLYLLITTVFLLGQSLAHAETSDFVKRAIVTSAIDAREPIDNLEIVSDLDKVFFFTEVINSANTMVTHRWFLNGRLEAEVVLKIGSDRWRTYSSKNLVYPNHVGNWQVEVTDQNNQVIGSAVFSVQ
ncbi:MAG: DUF2914 domain-containing protein [Gammaproteobacteria bacterium]|nr:DUF2914 domain-containing protein [Gammaproteobacteria bacterium]